MKAVLNLYARPPQSGRAARSGKGAVEMKNNLCVLCAHRGKRYYFGRFCP